MNDMTPFLKSVVRNGVKSGHLGYVLLSWEEGHCRGRRRKGEVEVVYSGVVNCRVDFCILAQGSERRV